MSSATRSSPPRSSDFAAARLATAYLSGEDTRSYRSWPPYLVVVVPLSTTWGRGWLLGLNKLSWLDSNLSRQEPEEDLVPASSDEGL